MKGLIAHTEFRLALGRPYQTLIHYLGFSFQPKKLAIVCWAVMPAKDSRTLLHQKPKYMAIQTQLTNCVDSSPGFRNWLDPGCPQPICLATIKVSIFINQIPVQEQQTKHIDIAIFISYTSALKYQSGLVLPSSRQNENLANMFHKEPGAMIFPLSASESHLGIKFRDDKSSTTISGSD